MRRRSGRCDANAPEQQQSSPCVLVLLAQGRSLLREVGGALRRNAPGGSDHRLARSQDRSRNPYLEGRVFPLQRERIIKLKAYPSGSGTAHIGDERAIGARLQPATDKMLIAPEATA